MFRDRLSISVYVLCIPLYIDFPEGGDLIAEIFMLQAIVCCYNE
jgi:hypothetical protein